jgi:hypothetical protein
VTNPRRSTRLRPALRAAWLAPLAFAGFLLAADPRHARADLLPTLPTVTTPLGTVTVPTVTTPVVTTTATSTTTATATTAVTTTVVAHTTTAPASTTVVASTVDSSQRGKGENVAGALPLAGGGVSVPVTSVRGSARLVVRLSLSARNLPDSKHRITARVRVADTRGYLVRGARIAVRSVPSGLLRKIANKASAKDGAASFLIQLRPGKPRRGWLTLVASAVDPTAPATAAASVRARVTLQPAVK